MTTGQRIQIREALRQARDQSVLALSATNAAIEKRARRETPAGIRTAAKIAQEIDQFIADHETARLLAIGGALEILHKKPELYGVCDECGRSISPARLRFNPWSSHCEQHAKLPIQ